MKKSQNNIKFVVEVEDDSYFIEIHLDNKKIGLLHFQVEEISHFIEDIQFFREIFDTPSDIEQIDAIEQKVLKKQLICHITHFDIDYHYRSCGYGKKLFSYSLDYINDYFFRKEKFIYLNASPTQGFTLDFLISFYSHFNFEIYLDFGSNVFMFLEQN